MWQQQIIETNRGMFEVFVAGEGEPLCVTHLYSEFNEKGNLFANQFVATHRVYLVNLRGCGQSTDDTAIASYSMADSVRDLEAIREALGLAKWAFAGHSTGGMLALVYAIQASSSLSFIVAGGLCASNDYMKNPASIYCKDNLHNARLREILAMLANPASTAEERQAGSKEWSLMSLYKASSYDKLISRPNSGKTVSKRLDYFSYEELPTFDVRPQLGDVTIPAFIYGGKYDAQCPYEYAVEAAALLGNATLTTFSRSNHFPFVEEEQAFEQFVKKMIQQKVKSR